MGSETETGLQGTTTHTKKEEENVAGLISAVMASMINEAH
jgi:hypothetical protein